MSTPLPSGAAPAVPGELATGQPAVRSLRLAIVGTPQPPLEAGPALPLVRHGIAPPRPLHRPGPRPREPHHCLSDFEPEWTSSRGLPDPRAYGRRLFVLALEGLAGLRPLAQLERLVAPRLYTALSSGRRPGWCSSGTAPVLLGPVHAGEPVDGVAEITVVARRSGRAHAVAARLEALDGRWRCTALQIG